MSRKETTIDDLARMVAEGFADMQTRMDKRFDGIQGEVSGLSKEMKQHHEKTDARLVSLELGQEEMKREFRNAATKFEVRDLDRRVTLLEKKAKFA